MNEAIINACTSAAATAAASPAGSSYQNTLLRAMSELDLASWIILSILILASVISWAVMIERALRFRMASSRIEKFLEIFDQANGDIYTVYLQAQKKMAGSPAAYLFGECYKEIQAVSLRQGQTVVVTQETIKAVERVCERALGEIQMALERCLILLATTANVAPMLGLFGTVWGVLVVFYSIGHSNGATVGISALAPGISAALMTTVCGLITAIPAALAYNIFLNRVNVTLMTLEAFGGRLCSVLARQLAYQSLGMKAPGRVVCPEEPAPQPAARRPAGRPAMSPKFSENNHPDFNPVGI